MQPCAAEDTRFDQSSEAADDANTPSAEKWSINSINDNYRKDVVKNILIGCYDLKRMVDIFPFFNQNLLLIVALAYV